MRTIASFAWTSFQRENQGSLMWSAFSVPSGLLAAPGGSTDLTLSRRPRKLAGKPMEGGPLRSPDISASGTTPAPPQKASPQETAFNSGRGALAAVAQRTERPPAD